MPCEFIYIKLLNSLGELGFPLKAAAVRRELGMQQPCLNR